MDIKDINFTDFIRYSLTGLNFILFVILVPILYLFPSQMKDIVSETSVLTILLFSIAVGYLMDMLKIYQFSPNFKRNKLAKPSKFLSPPQADGVLRNFAPSGTGFAKA